MEPIQTNTAPVWKYRKPLEVALWIPVVQIVAYEILHAKFAHYPGANAYLKKIKAAYLQANDGSTAFLFLTFFWAVCMKRKPPKWISLALATALVSSTAHGAVRFWRYQNYEKE